MCLFIFALRSPAGKGLTSWLLFVVSNCEFINFTIGILGQVWYLIVSIPDLCTLTYFDFSSTYGRSEGHGKTAQVHLNLRCSKYAISINIACVGSIGILIIMRQQRYQALI